MLDELSWVVTVFGFYIKAHLPFYTVMELKSQIGLQPNLIGSDGISAILYLRVTIMSICVYIYMHILHCLSLILSVSLIYGNNPIPQSLKQYPLLDFHLSYIQTIKSTLLCTCVHFTNANTFQRMDECTYWYSYK